MRVFFIFVCIYLAKSTRTWSQAESRCQSSWHIDWTTAETMRLNTTAGTYTERQFPMVRGLYWTSDASACQFG